MAELYTPIMNMIRERGRDRDNAIVLHSALSMVVNMTYISPLDTSKTYLLAIITGRLKALNIKSIETQIKTIEAMLQKNIGIIFHFDTLKMVADMMPLIITHYENIAIKQVEEQNENLSALLVRLSQLKLQVMQ